MFSRYAIIFFLFFALSFISEAVTHHIDERIILGNHEYIVLRDHDLRLNAKVDSGADTSSLHAEDIRIVSDNGKDYVEFYFSWKDAGIEEKVKITSPLVRTVTIRSTAETVERDRRPVVELDFCLDGETHTTQFTLVDRSGFSVPVLLGKRFLSGVALIDVGAENLTMVSKCEEPETNTTAKE